jgi:hypothetical protein
VTGIEPEAVFSFDGESQRRESQCASCGHPHEGVTGFVLRDDYAYAVYFADWYPHEDEAWRDIVLGSFDEPDYTDQVTFGCRIGHVDGQAGPACSLVQAATQRSDAAIFGQRLSRDSALEHPRLGEFWAVTDWLILNDRLLHEKVLLMPPSGGDD